MASSRCTKPALLRRWLYFWLTNSASCGSKFSVIALHDAVFGPCLAKAEGQQQRLAGIVMLRLAGGDDLDYFPHEYGGQPDFVVARLFHGESNLRIGSSEAVVHPNGLLAAQNGPEQDRDCTRLPALDGVKIDDGEGGNVVLRENFYGHRIHAWPGRCAQSVPHVFVDLAVG